MLPVGGTPSGGARRGRCPHRPQLKNRQNKN